MKDRSCKRVVLSFGIYLYYWCKWLSCDFTKEWLHEISMRFKISRFDKVPWMI